MADENPEKKTDRGILPKSTQRQKARAAIEAILGKSPENPVKEVIKPFAIENSQKSGISKHIPIPIIAIEASKKTPELDLDQKIMADQRKLSAVSRQRPGQKNGNGKEPARHGAFEHIRHQKPIRNPGTLGFKNIIIKEIVAKDIAKIYAKAIFAKTQKIR